MKNFRGIIHNVSYQPHVRTKRLEQYALSTFNANTASSTGLLVDGEVQLGYATWVSPKRTRSYPLARLYQIYHIPKKIAIIPIIKDEGKGGDCDRINAMTFSWMNLSNVFIVLAYYDDAVPHPQNSQKITKQQLNQPHIQRMIEEIMRYQQTALHWNTHHFERDFESIYRLAVHHYKQISHKTGVAIHDPDTHLNALNSYMVNNIFNLESYKTQTLESSRKASYRESTTHHALEYLGEGEKALFEIENYLGGKYYLTADEVYQMPDSTWIIQESKNATTRGQLPHLNDIQDGLFKLILFANMKTLYWQNAPQPFIVRLKLTAKGLASLQLPSNEDALKHYLKTARLTPVQEKKLLLLQEEAQHNPLLSIFIGDNT